MKRSYLCAFLALVACQPTVSAPPLILDGGLLGNDVGFNGSDANVPGDAMDSTPTDGGRIPGDSGLEQRADSGVIEGANDGGVLSLDASSVTQDSGSPEDVGVGGEDDDHGDRIEQATDIDGEREVTGRVEVAGDEDYFIFRSGAAGRYRIFTTGTSDTNCALFRLDGQLLNEDDDSGNGFNCLLVEVLEADQQYAVRVRLWRRERGSYTLMVEGPAETPPVCGDAQVEGEEECDDGNNNDRDSCLNCRRARCGDGVVRMDMRPGQLDYEFCDDGNDDAGDTCTTECLIPRCGDGYLWRGVEECDDGNEIDTDGCRLTCQVARCGDGVLFAGVEECDDGNQVGGDGCGVRCDAEDIPADCEAVQGRNRATIYCQTPRRTWAGAEAFCVAWGGHLLTVDNAADQRRLAAYGWRGDEMWIGLNDRADEGEFVWVGRNSAYRNWARGEPNNSGDREHCTHLWRQTWGAWNDADCDQNHAYFCER
ncbi:MAG: DUF4215 domain-containing protein [Myxococcota bacterium]|nr:DUF4215 domain-containing protein [Myxococcota bacterium]